jgi:Ca-activated chloride channel family protein
MPEDFHFLQPLWFLALIPLALLAWRVRNPGSGDAAWRRICDVELLPYLLVNPGRGAARLPVWLLAAGWLVAVVALADPVWEKQPQPVLRSQDARVVVLDLSRSMYTADLKPSRLARAVYKVVDILKRSDEGQVGLVAFAGDAFVVSPLTRDADTIAALVKALDPDIMPVQGSRADLGLRKAAELMQQAGAGRGEILLIADGFDRAPARDAAEELRAEGYRTFVLGVGTEAGGPLPNGSGGYVRDAAGNIVVPRLDTAAMRALASAGGGRYASISGNDADLDWLMPEGVPGLHTQTEDTGLETDSWQSRGPWLVVLLLPLAALAFRRGWLLGVVLLVAGTLVTPEPAMAAGWDDLWMRRDQQSERALEAGEFDRAAQLAEDPLRRGTAHYRGGDYAQALQAFAGTSGPDGAYNRGNALAQLGRYEEAIAAYQQALAEQPDMPDAEHNKAVIEELLRQQQQQQQDQRQEQQQQQDQDQDQDQQQQDQSGSDAHSSPQAGQQGGQDGNGASGADAQAQPVQGARADDEASQQASVDTAQDAQGLEAPAAQAGGDAGQQAGGSFPPAGSEERGEDLTRDAPAQAASTADDTHAQPPLAPEQPLEQASGSSKETAAGQARSPTDAQVAAEPLTSEEQQAAAQWLRRIPDDPGGLLRRKFLYQYQQRATRPATDGSERW